MSLIEYRLDCKIDKVKTAIERIKNFEPLAMGTYDKPYYVGYSGGKDSDVVRILMNLAGVPFDLVHNHTTIDAPETVYYIRTIPNVIIDMPDISMWNLIVKKKMPPTRMMRYCCSVLKEHGGKDRFVVTGVRWAESNQRKTRSSLEIMGKSKKEAIILNADNDINRKMIENCSLKGKRILNPIIDWSDDDVWEFLNHYNCKSNPLYECGDKRVGCIGCPMIGIKRNEHFIKYPKYKENYIKAFDRMIKNYTNVSDWNTGEDVFDWWMYEKTMPKQILNQIEMELADYE